MPFKSEKQRRFMFSQHPEIARRWATEGMGFVEGGKKMAKPRLGSGARFAAVEASARAGGARNPAAVAAAAGRKKYGKAKMAKMSAAGRRKHMEKKAAKGLKRAFPEY